MSDLSCAGLILDCTHERDVAPAGLTMNITHGKHRLVSCHWCVESLSGGLWEARSRFCTMALYSTNRGVRVRLEEGRVPLHRGAQTSREIVLGIERVLPSSVCGARL